MKNRWIEKKRGKDGGIHRKEKKRWKLIEDVEGGKWMKERSITRERNETTNGDEQVVIRTSPRQYSNDYNDVIANKK